MTSLPPGTAGDDVNTSDPTAPVEGPAVVGAGIAAGLPNESESLEPAVAPPRETAATADDPSSSASGTGNSDSNNSKFNTDGDSSNGGISSSGNSSSRSHLLVNMQRVWSARTPRELELRESSLDRPCLDYLEEQMQLLSANHRLLKLVIHLDDVSRHYQQPNPQAVIHQPQRHHNISNHRSRPAEGDGFTDEWIASVVESNHECLRVLRISAQNEILGHDHRRNPTSFMRILLKMKALERLYLSHFDLCPVHAAVILWDYFDCCLPPRIVLDDHGTTRAPPTITHSHYLRDLTLDQCLFDLTSIQMLSSGLRAYDKLQTLEMLHCGLTDTLIAPLLDALQQSKSRLTCLDLMDNHITSLSLKSLATLLHSQDCLTIFNLNENSQLFSIAPQNHPLDADPDEVAEVGGAEAQRVARGRFPNQADDSEADFRVRLQAFCTALGNHKSLTHLGLIACSVTAETLLPLLQALGSKKSRLQNLYLQQNSGLRLGDWCHCLRQLHQLRVLNLEEASLVPNRLPETHSIICQFLRELRLNLSLTDLHVSEFTGNANRNIFMRPGIRPIVLRNQYLWRVQELLIQHQDNRRRQDRTATHLPVGACAPLLHKLWSIQGGQTPVFSFLRSDFGANMIQEQITASTWQKKRKASDLEGNSSVRHAVARLSE